MRLRSVKEMTIRMMALHRFLGDWGVPRAAVEVALVLRIFAAVEYASGDRLFPWGEVSLFLALAGASVMAGGRGRKCASKAWLPPLPASGETGAGSSLPSVVFRFPAIHGFRIVDVRSLHASGW